jgi:hypothetical protein
MTQWPYQDARRGPLSSENHQRFRDAGGLPSLVVSRYSVAEALTERFPRPLVSIAGSACITTRRGPSSLISHTLWP